MKKPLVERLLDSLDDISIEGCWLSGNSTDGRGGYAKVRDSDGRTTYAHRAMYRELVGDIPRGLVLDHLCRVRRCINPDHLEPVTQTENLQRGLGTGPAIAVRMAATHCKWGHEYTDENTIRRRDTGARRCRTCQYASNAAGRQPRAVA